MSFKEQAAADSANVFLNVGEFADMHTIRYGGKEYSDVPVVLEKIRQAERNVVLQSDHLQGIYTLSAKAYFNEVDVGNHIPEQGGRFEIDDGEALGKIFYQRYRVTTCDVAMGMICLELEAYDERHL